jgi:dCMP deaminase
VATQEQLDKCYMNMAENISTLSRAVRKKVGCVLVTPESVILSAYNGTPSGWDNTCEKDTYNVVSLFGHKPEIVKTGTETLEVVLHAELNAILHAARQGVSVKGATLYTTLSCCTSCSAMVAQAGIKRLVFKEQYRDTTGIQLLKEHGIIVEQLTVDNQN